MRESRRVRVGRSHSSPTCDPTHMARRSLSNSLQGSTALPTARESVCLCVRVRERRKEGETEGERGREREGEGGRGREREGWCEREGEGEGGREREGERGMV